MSGATAVSGSSTVVVTEAPRRVLRRGRRRHTALFSALAVIAALIWLFPVYWMVSGSFKLNSDLITSPPTWWPAPFSAKGYQEAFAADFWEHLFDSLKVTCATVAIAMVLSVGAAMAVARYRFRGRATMLVMLIGVQMVPFGGLLIPMYVYLNIFNLLNIPGLVLVYIAPVLPFTIWMLRGFVVSVPKEVEEAALTDGCSRVKAFMTVVFPLIAPGLVATAIFGFISAWNELVFATTILAANGASWTLPVWLEEFITPTSQVQWNAIFAGSVLYTIPVLIFFLIIQRRMMAGLTAGAVKG